MPEAQTVRQDESENSILICLPAVVLFRLIQGFIPFILFGCGIGTVIDREGFWMGFVGTLIMALGGQGFTTDAKTPSPSIPFRLRVEIYLLDFALFLSIGCLSFWLFFRK